MTTIIVAVIGGAFGLATIWLQARVHKDNRHDHAATAAVVEATAAAVDKLAEGHTELLAGQHEMRADLRDVKADLREHHQRLRVVETEPEPAARPKPRKSSRSAS